MTLRDVQVFRLEDCHCVYTLYGHKASISALCLDDDGNDPLGAVSGGEEGSVRVWDLGTGVCLHKLHGHTAPVVSVTSTRRHVVSTGQDDRLCIWDRPRGTLLHWIQMVRVRSYVIIRLRSCVQTLSVVHVAHVLVRIQ